MTSLAVGVLCLLAAPCLPLGAQDAEPSVSLAKLWWPEQYNVWTPVGWPDHYFKAAVLYNGTIVVDPGVAPSHKPHAAGWIGEDFQLTFCPSEDGHPWAFPPVPVPLREWDGGLGIQSWDPDHAAPLLCTEYRSKEGVVLETKAFAHITGGEEVKTALEPEYLWIRVAVKHVDEYYHPAEYRMSVLLSRLFLSHYDIGKYAPDIRVDPSAAPCSGPLHAVPSPDGELTVEDGKGKVRLGVFPGKEEKAAFDMVSPGVYHLCLTFPAKVGSFVDLLLPALPEVADTFRTEAAVTYFGALAQADAYWQSLRPGTEATFDVPEPFVSEAIRENFRIARVLGQKDHATGDYSYISGVWGYDAYWPTPGSMVSAMFMDPMGHFDDTERYLEVFAKLQGARKAPGASYQMHPGYFSTPAYLESVDWLTDHGAVMYMAATHALLSGDQTFIDRWSEPLVKACDFIKEYSLSEHPGVPGLLPAGWSTDEEVPLQSVWSLAWNYKGLSETVRLLQRIGHPRAEEFESFRLAFKETFQREYRKASEAGARWADARGNVRFRPPNEFVIESGSRFQTDGRVAGHTFMTDAFYLDCGPLCLVWAGLMDADDPLMEDMLAFFREGPNRLLRSALPWSLDRAVLDHEMSSCEPCYSFNAFHSWQTGDRAHFLEAMYSILVGAISQQTFISCEHRHGIQGTQFAFPLGFHLARLAVIDDIITPGSLHLLRFCPQAWLTEDRPARFLDMPTEFGPVSVKAQLSRGGRQLDVSVSADWRTVPQEVIIHIPPVPGLKRVCVNGRRYRASRQDIRIHPVSRR